MQTLREIVEGMSQQLHNQGMQLGGLRQRLTAMVMQLKGQEIMFAAQEGVEPYLKQATEQGMRKAADADKETIAALAQDILDERVDTVVRDKLRAAAVQGYTLTAEEILEQVANTYDYKGRARQTAARICTPDAAETPVSVPEVVPANPGDPASPIAAFVPGGAVPLAMPVMDAEPGAAEAASTEVDGLAADDNAEEADTVLGRSRRGDLLVANDGRDGTSNTYRRATDDDLAAGARLYARKPGVRTGKVKEVTYDPHKK